MLSTFEWDRRYETRIEHIDEQHKGLVDLLNDLIEIVVGHRQAEPAECDDLLARLEAYAGEHFGDEERLMREGGCDPRHIEVHVQQHRLFVEQVRIARTEYGASDAPMDILELLAGFITTWLSFHVLGSDRSMVQQLERVRSGQPAERRMSEEQEREAGATRILVDALTRLYQVMARRNLALASARDELAALNAELERRVAERTAALEGALAEVERTREQLLQSEKMSAIGQLAAGIAHEINNPVGFVSSNLASLKQYVARLLDLVNGMEQVALGPSSPASLDAEIRALKEQADFTFLREDLGDLLVETTEGLDRVKKIVQDMKVFSHVDEAAWEVAELHDILDSTLNVVAHELKYKAEVERRYGDLRPIRCLPAQLGQVFMNILVNAAQAIRQMPGHIVVETRPLEGGVELVIEDNGTGMPPEVIKRIFEPFFTTKPAGTGTGLGMSISYEIVKRHGGDLWVDSTPGEGSRFTLRLPLEPPGQSGAGSARPS